MKNKHLAKLSAVMITMILAVNGSFAMAEENPEAAEPTVTETTVLPQAEESAPTEVVTEVVTEPVTQTVAETPATAEVPVETTTVQETAPTDTTTQESSAETTQVQETTEVVTEETETGAAEEPEAAAQQTEETAEEETVETPAAETQDTVPAEEQAETDPEEQEEAEDPKDTSDDEAEEPAEEEEEPAFTGSVRVERFTTGVLYYGDTAVLQAIVTNANKDYTLQWQVKENKNLDIWTVLKNDDKYALNGDSLSVKLDEKDSERAYRAVLVVKENDEENEYKSEAFAFQGLTEKPEDEKAEQVEETTAEETASTEEIAKDIKIYAVWENNDPQIGNDITFYVELNGHDESNCRIQWQHSEDNVNWEDIAGANELSYTVTATEDNCEDYWRARITEGTNE